MNKKRLILYMCDDFDDIDRVKAILLEGQQTIEIHPADRINPIDQRRYTVLRGDDAIA
jgi:hypothetical protein